MTPFALGIPMLPVPETCSSGFSTVTVTVRLDDACLIYGGLKG
jgi:hypothetical protein